MTEEKTPEEPYVIEQIATETQTVIKDTTTEKQHDAYTFLVILANKLDNIEKLLEKLVK